MGQRFNERDRGLPERFSCLPPFVVIARLPLFLGQPAHDDVSLQRRQMIDEQHAFQVVDLVLEAGVEQAVGFYLLACARGAVQIADLAARWLGDLGILPRKREATFLPGGTLVGEGDDFRVDQGDRRGLVVRHQVDGDGDRNNWPDLASAARPIPERHIHRGKACFAARSRIVASSALQVGLALASFRIG